MKRTIKNLLVGTSVAVGMSAVAAPAFAASLTNVTMFGSDYGTYGATDAVTALTDGDNYSHVELNFSSENLSNSTTGFTGNLGVDSIKVEGITQDDWNNEVAAMWMADFTQAYPALASAEYSFMGQTVNLGTVVGGSIAQRAGDPNVSSITKDDATGEISFDTIGHYNVWDAPWVDSYLAQYNALPGFSDFVAAVQAQTPVLQISEIAKVTINGEVSYAYGFSAVETGVVAADASDGDTSSHTGRYTVALNGTPEGAQVPEPSLLLGLTAIGGLVASSRKSKKA